MNERENMNDDPTDSPLNPLNEAQLARAAALACARAMLIDDNSSPITSHASLPKRFGTGALLRLADWILASPRTIAVVRVPDEQVDAVNALNPVPSEDFPEGGLLIVPESASASAWADAPLPRPEEGN